MKATKESKYNALFNKLIGVNDLPNRLIEIAKDLEYPIFRKNDSYPINLNIWGIRSKSSCTKHYNDVIVMFYERDFNIWECMVFEATTDPSNLNLETARGISLSKRTFTFNFSALWKIGKHKGQYKALVQANPCQVIRDNNRDDKIDITDNTDFGMFGINLHRASSWKVSDEIGLYSAGCQVIKDVNQWNDIIIPLFDKAIGKGTQSYVLINEMDLDL